MGLLDWFTRKASPALTALSTPAGTPAPGATARLRIDLVHTTRVPPGRGTNDRPGTNSVVISHDGRCAATGHADGLVRIWDVTSGTLTRTLEGHQWGNVFVALSADGSTALSACTEGSICQWNLKTGALVGRFATAGQGRLSMVGLTADVTLAATNKDSDSSEVRDGIVLWDVATGRRLRELPSNESGAFSAALSPDGRFAAAGTQTGRIILWDLDNADAREVFVAHPEAQPYGAAVCFSGDGQYFGTYGRVGWGGSAEHDRTMKIWSVDQRRCVTMLSGHAAGITSLSLSANGAVALSTALDHTVYIWDAMSGRRTGDLPGDVEAPTVAISACAEWAVGGSFVDQRLRFWKLTWP